MPKKCNVKAPGLNELIKKLEKREKLFNQLPITVTEQDKLLVQGPKLWQAPTNAEEKKLAEFEKNNQLAINALKAKIEDPLRNIMR